LHEQFHQRRAKGGVYLLYLRSCAFKYRYILCTLPLHVRLYIIIIIIIIIKLPDQAIASTPSAPRPPGAEHSLENPKSWQHVWCAHVAQKRSAAAAPVVIENTTT
jgi:hypothetical protein